MYRNYKDYNEVEKKEVVRVSYDLVDMESFERAKKNYEVIIVYAWTDWCNPCKLLAPKFEILGQKYEEQMKRNHLLFLKDNVDKDSSIHQKHVHVVPTFFIYIQGELKEIFTGVDYNKLESFLNNYFEEKMNNMRIFK